jgi:hypothetical protein
MLVRLKATSKTSSVDYRLTVELVDSNRQPWEPGDCVMRVDLHDGPTRHLSTPRGPLKLAFELYSLSPKEPPIGPESRLLWDIGQAVHRYVERLFEAGILCPFQGAAEDAPERSE